jgi:hypothetical protein
MGTLHEYNYWNDTNINSNYTINVDTIDWSTTTVYGSTWSSSDGYPIISQTKERVVPESKKKKNIEGVEFMVLYDVYLVYGENRKKPVVIREQVVARDEEDAKVKSGLMAKVDQDWDADYLTFICDEIGEVKVKERPKEVKNV